MANPPQPKIIFLDAVGTLFGVSGSVGDIYAQLAQHHGITADPATLNQAFFRAFMAAPAMAFPGSDPATIPEQEYLWWRVIAQQTFSSAGVLDSFVDFDGFFADLYAHFAGPEPWVLYPDVSPALERWRRRGITLGVISNFDTRLYQVLDELALTSYFSSITLSSEAGAAKPDSLIFATALQKHGCEASQAWHVGDSKTEDLEGANAAGLHGILVKRQGD
jgi:putative hydrolase of the HAD superfamily